MDSLTRPAMLLVGGRAVGLAASFAIGIVLARLFEPAAFGTYKQFFLVFGTLYGLVQLGMAESLYYFVPRRIEDTGRYVCNAMLVLAGAGLACLALLSAARDRIAAAMSNPALAEHALLLGIFLVGMLVSAVLEIAMIARGRHAIAAATYAASDVARTVLFIAPALIVGTVSSVLAGAALFAAIRLVATVVGLWRTFGRRLRPDVPLLRLQLAYALPFALAVGVEVVYLNYHQWVVASTFDAATFAIYA
ncbi:MAG TPA: oligosaccharide flippase family protein, partial [Vicinamibacterales bacterium]|nr:oligosaccharide flippase family protein [Vicinamibacterales bacterium]